MTDIVITAANVLPGTDTVIVNGLAGATITQGQVLYLDASTNTWKLADANHATAAIHKASGVALTSASSGQPIAVATGGTITAGGTLTAGSRYYCSGNAGGLAPEADLTTTWEVTLVGIATSASLLKLAFLQSGVTL